MKPFAVRQREMDQWTIEDCDEKCAGRERPEGVGEFARGVDILARGVGVSPRAVEVTVNVKMTVRQALELARVCEEHGNENYAPAFNYYSGIAGMIARQAYRAMRLAE